MLLTVAYTFQGFFCMGLKLQPSGNLLTSLLKNNHNVGALIFTPQETRTDLNNQLLKLVGSSGLDQVQASMDRLLDHNNQERVRNTILRQEEIFKQQVHELHRLYQVQRILMAEVRTKGSHFANATPPRAVTDTKSKHWSSSSTSETSHSSLISNRNQTAFQLNFDYNSLYQHNVLAKEAPTRHNKAFNLEQPADEECNVELTLSLGCSSSKKHKNWNHPEATTSATRPVLQSNTGARAERGEECSERESLQRPPWLFQAMSLNRT